MTKRQDSEKLALPTEFCSGFKRLLTVTALLVLVSCGSSPGNVIGHGTGTQMGTVSASATLTENRATGEVTGDTKNYGFFDRMADAVTKQLQDSGGAKVPKGAMNVAEKAYAIVVYDIIQQVRAKGGNVVTNVLSEIDRNYDPETKIETIKIDITADAIKSSKK